MIFEKASSEGFPAFLGWITAGIKAGGGNGKKNRDSNLGIDFPFKAAETC
jgi:hypothetical protein